jgi:hypothetical protein
MKQKRNYWIRVEKQQIWFKLVALEHKTSFKEVATADLKNIINY